ncbi:MAG: SO_0444 family Cu/Zn efflux transporter [Bacteroidales bacterium]
MDKYITPFFVLLNEMSPYLLLGFLVAGLLHVFVPRNFYARHLSKPSVGSVLKAALFGIPLPLCSCGVLPTAMSLRKEGSSAGATGSFLIATPQTGVDSIFATYSLLGLPFAIIRPLVALVTALLGGTLINLFSQSDHSDSSQVTTEPADAPKTQTTPFGTRLLEAVRYGMVDMVQDLGKWLLLGLVVAAIITIFVPDTFFARFADQPLLNMVLVLLLSVPMYLCATGSIPIALALMAKGLTPGAALVLLMAGPATNIASILVIGKVMGRKVLLLYLFSIFAGAIGFGWLIDRYLPASWFTGRVDAFTQQSCHLDSSYFNIASSILFLIVVGHAFYIKRFPPKNQLRTTRMKTYKIKGMDCNHCRLNVEKTLSALAGTESVNVNLPKGIAYVEGDVPDEKVIEAITALGYEYVE